MCTRKASCSLAVLELTCIQRPSRDACDVAVYPGTHGSTLGQRAGVGSNVEGKAPEAFVHSYEGQSGTAGAPCTTADGYAPDFYVDWAQQLSGTHVRGATSSRAEVFI